MAQHELERIVGMFPPLGTTEFVVDPPSPERESLFHDEVRAGAGRTPP